MAEAEILDFEFLDASGKTFKTTKLLTQLEQRDNYRYENMNVLLIETPSLNDQNYLKQEKILDSMDHGGWEQLSLMQVTSCWTEEYKHGYHTSMKTAESLAGKNKMFRVTLIDEDGKVYFRNNNPISLEMLIKVITENKRIKS